MANPSWDDTAPVSEAAAPSAGGAPTWDQTTSNEEKFGGIGGAAKAAALSAADMLSFGGASQLLTKSGMAEPETLKGIEETNPKSVFAGGAAGLGIAHLYGVGEAEDAIAASRLALKAAVKTGNAVEIAKATEALSAVKNTLGAGDLLNPVKAISKVGGKVSEAVGPGVLGTAAGAAAEGALFGAGQTVSEQALGDPDTVAESLMHNMGYGALIGGGIGTTLGVGAKAISKIPETIGSASKVYKKAASTVDQILADTPRGTAPILDPDIPASSGIKSTSIEELQARAAKAIERGEDIALPQRDALTDAASRIEMENPITPMQVDSLGSQGKRDDYRIMKDMPGEYRDILQKNEALQKGELVRKTDEAIRSISPGIEPTADAVEGGHRAAEAFTDVIEGNRKELGPMIRKLKDTKTTTYHLPGIIDELTNPELPYGNAKLANMFDTEGKEIAVKPFSTRMGIDERTYRKIAQMVKDVDQTKTSVEMLFDIRKALTEGLNVMETGAASTELTKAKAGMMEYIQKIIQKQSPDAEVRNWFRRYAINEENAKIIEKKFGAEIGTDNWRSVAKNKPSEKILDNIFRDTESVKAARAILSPDKFNEMLANHLSEQRQLVTTDGAFSSNKFFSKSLKGNQDALNEAFAYRPELHQRIKDLNTIMRILPDSAPVNPSGTAKTLVGAISLNPMKLADNLKEWAGEKFQHQRATDELNQRLAGTAQKVETVSTLQRLKDKGEKQIASAVKSIFNVSEKGVGFISSKLIPEEKKKDHLKFAEQVTALSNNPQAMLEKITGATHDLYPGAPQVTASVHSLAIRATQFLASKVPQTPSPSPLSAPIEPSASQLATFDRYRQAVDSPVDALKNIKNGLLSSEEMETLQVVYPKLLSQMQKEVFSQISSMKDPSKIPFQTKITLSRFMGEPMSASITPQSIIASQSVYAQPSQQEQNVAQNQQNKTNVAELSKSKRANRISLTPNDEVG